MTDPRSVPTATPDDWPFPPNSFVRASRLVEDSASDQQVRAAIESIEDGDSR